MNSGSLIARPPSLERAWAGDNSAAEYPADTGVYVSTGSCLYVLVSKVPSTGLKSLSMRPIRLFPSLPYATPCLISRLDSLYPVRPYRSAVWKQETPKPIVNRGHAIRE